MTQMPRHSPPSPAQDDAVALFAQRRAATDLIATTRARTIRAALFATYLFRPHPTTPEDQSTRAQWRAILSEQHQDMVNICQLLDGEDSSGKVCKDVCNWISEHATRNPTAVNAFQHIRDLTYDLCTAANGEDATELETALEAHKAYGRGGFFDVVTEFCDGLWAQLDEKRREEMERASATAKTISKTLARLQHIGKHVRLVSLNASIEAARVGDAGRGLGVIAVEFKTLAEEIQLLATTASADISTMARDVEGAPPSTPMTET